MHKYQMCWLTNLWGGNPMSEYEDAETWEEDWREREEEDEAW